MSLSVYGEADELLGEEVGKQPIVYLPADGEAVPYSFMLHMDNCNATKCYVGIGVVRRLAEDAPVEDVGETL